MNNASWYTSKWAVVSYHILAWIAWFVFPYLMQSGMSQQRLMPSPEMMEAFSKITGRPFHRPPDAGAIMRISFIQNLVLLGIFYSNACYLVPKFLYKRRVARYAVIMLTVMCLFTCLIFKLHSIITGDSALFRGPKLSFPFFFLFITAVSTSYRIITDKINSDRLQKEKENANLKTELSFLRSQISPHFVFNVLNNMVALARKKSEQLEPSLIRLSGLMRYMLYEANADKTLLAKELEYLQGYVELQQQRFANQVKVCLQIECSTNNYFIEPMLLIPFVENAFKHGIGLIEKPVIDIIIKETEGNLTLQVKNNFNNSSGEIKDKTSGIGLSNVKRRLDLLYGSRHTLLIQSNDDVFLVQLQLNLN